MTKVQRCITCYTYPWVRAVITGRGHEYGHDRHGYSRWTWAVRVSSSSSNNNNNNNNSHDNVYGAVIMTKVIARVHLVHLMNVDWAPRGRQSEVDLGCKSAENWQLSSKSTIAIVIITQPVGWYSFYRPTTGGRLSRPKHCSKGAQPWLYIAAAVTINTTVSGVIRTWILSHRSQMRWPLGYCTGNVQVNAVTIINGGYIYRFMW